MKNIKLIKSALKSFLCIVLLLATIGNIPALAQSVDEITNCFERAFGFPIDFFVNELSNHADTDNAQNNGYSLSATLKSAFAQCEEFYLHIMHWESSETFFSDIVSSTTCIKIDNLEINKPYPYELRIYNVDSVRYYSGTIQLELQNDSVAVTVEHYEGEKTRNYKYVIESSTLSDEEYESIYNQLEIPSYISFETAKEHKHLRQLEEYRQSLTEIGFVNHDGTCTVYSFPSPIKYIDSNGTVRDFDSNFISTSHGGYAFKNAYNDLTTYYSNKNESTKNLKISTKTDQIEYGFFTPSTENSANLLDAISSLFFSSNEAEVIEEYNEKKIKFSSNGCSIAHTPSSKGIKSTIVFERHPEDNKIQMWINKGAFQPILGDNGKSVFFTNEKNQILYSLGSLQMKRIKSSTV